MKYFNLEESPYMPTYSVIEVNHEAFKSAFPNGIDGSYILLPARLLNLSYADYLRYCRDKLEAFVVGKGHKYPVAYFRATPEVQQFLKLLNKSAEYAMFEHDHPYNIEIKLDGTAVKVYED